MNSDSFWCSLFC